MMDVFANLFASGHIIDFILALMALEAVALLVFNRMTGRGVSPRAILPFIAAGACLMLSLRVALTGGSWQLIALLLMAAFVMHLLDIGLRWRR
jgi:fatty acid desaturase